MTAEYDETSLDTSKIDAIAEACSHQLGEAVAIITGYVGVLREAGTSEPATLRAVDGGVDRVRRVVEDLLDLTRVAGRSSDHERVALGDVVAQAVNDLGTDGLGLDVIYAEPLPDVVGDAEQLVCALRHVLRAAAAARDPGQLQVQVRLSAERTPLGRVQVSVVDDAAAPPGLVGGLARGRGPLVGAGAADLIIDRVAAAHGGIGVRTSADESFVGFDLPAAP